MYSKCILNALLNFPINIGIFANIAIKKGLFNSPLNYILGARGVTN